MSSNSFKLLDAILFLLLGRPESVLYRDAKIGPTNLRRMISLIVNETCKGLLAVLLPVNAWSVIRMFTENNCAAPP